jgi:Carboxypeptidase regulatory-like domain
MKLGIVSRRVLKLLITSLWCAGSFSVSAAQTVVSAGTVRGVVNDKSGAVVPDAAVVLLLRGSGQNQTRTTNGAGIFLFSSQPVGVYTLEVSAAGFGKTIVEGVYVQVGQATAVDVELQPGAKSESITVNGESPLLRAEDSDQSSVVNRELLDGLPLNGRRFLDFALLVPNAAPDGQNGLVTFAGEQGGEDTGYANGNGANSFSVDGASATSNYFGNARGGEKVPYIFGENAIEEFQVAVSPYRAEYGGAATGFVNVVTRSGSDTLHGGAFYYNRNSGTGANDEVSKANGLARPVDILQQFGGSIGGPVLPNRAWFFADYEQQREKDPITAINPSFVGLGPADFGVSDGTQLPAPNAPFPVPGTLTTPDPNNPAYLQGVANALNAIQSNLGVQPRFRNDWSSFSKIDYRDSKDDRFYLSLNWNRFDSPGGFILGTQTALFGKSTLANAFVRDYQASTGWSHAYGSNLLNEVHAAFSRDDQYSTPTGLVDPALPTVLLVPSGGESGGGGTNFQLGNAGFAGGRTNEALWQLSDHVSYLRGKHTFKFGIEFTHTHLTDLAFGGFDPDAQAQNGTFRGTYAFTELSNFALGIYDNFFQSTGKPKFSFDVPYAGFYVHDTYQIRPRLMLDLGVREDFQVFPQPKENPAFPITGQFPNQYQRLAPRFGFAWQPLDKTVIRGGIGVFYENLNGLNYRNSVISNGTLSQQASVSYVYGADGSRIPNQQTAVFPNQITDPSQFSASNISLVDPHFRIPYILQGSLQIEREILRDTVFTIGTTWTHAIHLASSSAYDLNLNTPVGTTTYSLCAAGATDTSACTGRSVVLPNLDSNLLTEGRSSPKYAGQLNALISPGINNYNAFFVQGQRRFRDGLAFQTVYTFSKNIMSRGVDFNNQFDFSNTRAPYLLDQRHRLSIAAIYESDFASDMSSAFLRDALSHWAISTTMQFASGRPYSALLGVGALSNSVNNTAALQSTPNSALGINANSPSPVAGLDSFYGPWTQQIDLGLTRRFNLTERHAIALQAQVFNLLNHANYYVQNGTGVNSVQYTAAAFGNNPDGSTTCGDGATLNQTCYLVPNPGFGKLQVINALNGPRVMQFALKWMF